ncbi:MAG: flagellar export chaperone FliS [Bacillota bacterium]|nr:flagellar export chaperone FliS [Bacillota bacterium]
MSIDVQARYLQAQVQTATPEMLITMLYDGALRFLRQARAQIAGGKMSEANASLVRAEEIIAELNGCLDMERGGEIAANLRLLYDYLLRRLVEANVKKDPQIVEEVARFIGELREVWVEAVRTVQGSLRSSQSV